MNDQKYNINRKPGAPVREKPQAVRPKNNAGAVVQLSGRALMRKKREEEWKREDKKIERVRHGVDRPMLAIIAIILLLGTIMVFSASFPSALLERGDSAHYLKRQLIFIGGGGLVMLLFSFIPLHIYKKLTPAVYVVAIFLLLVVLVIGTSEGVAKRWIQIGSFTFQPSEAGKVGVIMMLAWYFDKFYDRIQKKIDRRSIIMDGVVHPGIIMAIICGLVLLERHLSGTIIIALISVCVIFLGGVHIGWAVSIYGACGAAAIGAFLALNPYALQRILTHADENADVLGEAWQTTQGLYAIGSGGLLGVGLGDSRLKYNYVSEPQNDFIFTIWCEEMGFVGAIIVVLLYAAFIWRGFVIAKKAPDTYSSLVAFGITCQVGIQAFLNMMVVTDLIPNTGISLPFFSYGGTALIVLLAEMGLLLSISRHSYQKK